MKNVDESKGPEKTDTASDSELSDLLARLTSAQNILIRFSDIAVNHKNKEQAKKLDLYAVSIYKSISLLEKIPCTKDGKPIFFGDTVYCVNQDITMLSTDDAIPMTVESMSAGVQFDDYNGTYTIMGDDYECGNLECYSERKIVPVFEC